MKDSYIKIKKIPYEEPYHLNLIFSASNGLFCGHLDFYCSVDDIKRLGKVLSIFPREASDEYIYKIGSPNPKNNCAYFFQLRAYTINMIGHCALQIRINNNEEKADEGACRFSIKVEPTELNRLGELLLTFSKLRHKELNWSLSGDLDSLIEE